MLSNKEVLDTLRVIEKTLAKAIAITCNNYLVDPVGAQTHPAGVEREAIFEYLSFISHASDALHMEMRAEDHPEIMDGGDERERDEADDIPF